jgi:hypothetical protein
MLGNIIFCFRRRDLGTAYTMGKGKVNNTAVTFFFFGDWKCIGMAFFSLLTYYYFFVLKSALSTEKCIKGENQH